MKSRGLKMALLGIIGATLLTLSGINPVFNAIPVVGNPSPSYDCDDAALALYRYFQKLGIEATPVVGNLELTGENFTQCNHVWLLVHLQNGLVAYDWGRPRFDRQHYEGYIITLDYLIYAVRLDQENPELLGLAGQSQ